MRRRISCLVLGIFLTASVTHWAGYAEELTRTDSVPRMIQFGSVLTGVSGYPMAGVQGVSFSIYEDAHGGSPLWMETQNVTVDVQGRYAVLLGAGTPDGLPLDLFQSGRPRWLEVRVPGQQELQRIMLVSVPYALKAADAETLGGKPLSSFLLADRAEDKSSSQLAATKDQAPPSFAVGGTPTVNQMPKFQDTAGTLIDSAVSETGGKVGIGTTAPDWPLHVRASTQAIVKLESTTPGASDTAFQLVTPDRSWVIGSNPGGIGAGKFSIFDINAFSSRLAIDTQGKVGIGTTAPDWPLHVRAATQAIVKLESTTPGASDTAFQLVTPDRSWVIGSNPGGIGAGKFSIFDINAFSSRMTIDTNGRVGIGTVAPAEVLDVVGNLNVSGSIRGSLVGGFGGNAITNGVISGTISGGGVSGGANRVTDDSGTVAGGTNNLAGDNAGTTSDSIAATVGGGATNSALRGYSTVAGGQNNTASAPWATVAGGNHNTSSGFEAFVGSGQDNVASGTASAVGGGAFNLATATYSTVAGGESNAANAGGATVGGGFGNNANGVNSAIPGGSSNVATGNFSFAAGRRAHSDHQGSFVWGDSTNADVNSTVVDQFTARAAGGVRFFSDSGMTTGVSLAAGSGSWSSISDRAAKENFSAVDSEALLVKLNSIQMETWNYKTQDASVRHLGPMAQDFRTAFGLGEDDKHISAVDADGVALAGIQALYRLLLQKDEEIEALKQQLNQLQRTVHQLQSK